ncbi:MAG: CoA pyrophosphatase [Prolixibacteraceae bacterium]|nr:CoA pyrophosphatase [Prolixibacteraceae bacterium]
MQNRFLSFLSEALTGELPGLQAHRKMVPPGRRLLLPEGAALKVKHSGVLFLLFPDEDQLFTCLIKRPASMKHHPGQIGFPGGKVEKNDLSPQMAAMREAGEEVGISPGSYRMLGKLSDLYIQVSNFIIHPYVAWADRKPDFTVNYSEVEKIILFPVQDFMRNEHISETEINTFSGLLKVPYYPFDGELIWGATAMILSEYFEITKCYQPVPE